MVKSSCLKTSVMFMCMTMATMSDTAKTIIR